MEGFVLVLILLSVVIPVLMIGSQRARRTQIMYSSSVSSSGASGSSSGPPEPTPASALAGWSAPSEEGAGEGAASAGLVIGGHPVKCGHCGGVDFEEREGQLNTAMASFFNVDWANRSAACLVCLRCRHIEWFLF